MNRMYSFRRWVSLALLLLLCFGIFSACDKEPSQPEEDDIVSETVVFDHEAEFDLLLEELFKKYVTCDSLTLNYSIANPSSYGIEKLDPPTLGEAPSAETIRKDIQENQELREKLGVFIYAELREDQQVIYDMLVRDLEIMEIMESNDDFSYYLGAFFPIAGIHVQLPIIMAEFSFYEEDDIEVYMRLLEDTRRYFDELIEFERERSRRGFFLSDASVDEVIAHCESFLNRPDENIMILVFNDKIDNYEGLSGEQREQYKLRNRELIMGSVLPAYEALMGAMHELRGVGAHQGGLATLPEGWDFARVYLRDETGSDINPKQIEAMLIERMGDMSATIGTLLNEYPYLGERLTSGTLGYIADEAPIKFLHRLERVIVNDFPAIKPTRYIVREVHASMQDFVSPAFYMIPALDHYNENTIYINPANDTEGIDLLAMLAHEGYPGHLYQTVYYLQQSPHPIRTAMNYSGYVEGWATYVEYQSYHYAGLAEEEAILKEYMSLFDLLFAARIDLGVNVLGWDLEIVASLCMQYGINDPEIHEQLFQAVIGYPLQYMPYTVGYLEFASMREDAEDELGDSFDSVAFHRFLLDFGPAPFTLINRHFQAWLNEQPAGGALAPAA